MLKPLHMDSGQIREGARTEHNDAIVKDAFRALHGFYGTLFTAKYATGEVDSKGKDKGILSARMVWGYELRWYDRLTVGSAIDACRTAHPEYPPSLPQFVALCAASRPREPYRPAVPAIGMAPALRSQYARQAREINARHAAAAASRQTGDVELTPGLTGLKQAVARAVADAGGDEGAALLRLDRLYPPQEPSPTRKFQ